MMPGRSPPGVTLPPHATHLLVIVGPAVGFIEAQLDFLEHGVAVFALAGPHAFGIKLDNLTASTLGGRDREDPARERANGRTR